MKLETLLKLQVLYCAMGIAYNIISVITAGGGGRPLSSTPPAAGIGVMIAYGLFLVPGFLKKITVYRILMLVALLVLGYGGVVTHLLNYSRMDLYHSTTAWASAVAINLFGAVLNLMAVSKRFTVLFGNNMTV